MSAKPGHRSGARRRIVEGVKVAQLGDLDRESEQLLFHVVRAVSDATHAGDPYMTGHSSRVAAYCEKIAESLALPPRERLMLFIAAAFHDVGYLSTPEYILRKPSVLAEDEMEEVRVHPVRGAEVFGAHPALAEIARPSATTTSGSTEAGIRRVSGETRSPCSRESSWSPRPTGHDPPSAVPEALSADEATRRLRGARVPSSIPRSSSTSWRFSGTSPAPRSGLLRLLPLL